MLLVFELFRVIDVTANKSNNYIINNILPTFIKKNFVLNLNVC